MTANSRIEWTDHTFNPWCGCTKVSAGCTNCYAEALMDKRFGRVQWGPQGTRSRTSDAEWRKPLAWNRQQWMECPACGRRGQAHTADSTSACPTCNRPHPNPTHQRVFCASLADVFEEKDELFEWRKQLLTLIEDTPNLDWLLLTKRPENIRLMIADCLGTVADGWLSDIPNIWFGTSIENQKTADERIPELLRIPARVRFLSVEPLLGTVDLSPWLLPNESHESHGILTKDSPIDWIIVGGESGPNARPMHPDWARSIRNQCQAAGVPFHFKQWGEFLPFTQKSAGTMTCKESEYFQNLKVQTLRLPQRTEIGGSLTMYKVGKKAAGRLLDGQEWSEFPAHA